MAIACLTTGVMPEFVADLLLEFVCVGSCVIVLNYYSYYVDNVSSLVVPSVVCVSWFGCGPSIDCDCMFFR